VKNLQSAVQYLWAICTLAQAAVCGLLIARKNFRILPIFTTFVVLNLCQGLFLYLIYAHYGPNSNITYTYAWWSEAVTLTASGLAVTEILRRVLAPYRGIWGLAWRVLGATSSAVVISVALASRGDAGWALLTADRGYHLLFAVALVSCFLLIRYYFIPVDQAYKSLLAGFCFFSCFEVLTGTILQGFLFKQNPNFEPIWQLFTVSAYLAVQVLWTTALARPLPVPQKHRLLLPASVYERVSPEINYQLQKINQQLMAFWKIEEPEQ
jgi:hypothetical protein